MGETIENLLDAAESGIRLRGYHAVSFRDLAAELGIKSSSVHYYFRQKEDLGIALVKRYGERFFAALYAQADRSDDPVRTYCKIYRQALIDSDRICLCGMLGAENCGLPAALTDAVAGFFKANIDWVTNFLPDTLPMSARRSKAAHIVATLQGAMMLANSLKDHKIFDSAVQDLLAKQAR